MTSAGRASGSHLGRVSTALAQRNPSGNDALSFSPYLITRDCRENVFKQDGPESLQRNERLWLGNASQSASVEAPRRADKGP